ncbi:MAG TPA: EAL domain-containing protein, partial [Candidatus Saccharimonadia bacterium]|nr:EAL domain-containing protein [Candidatus Saccharimonadia bacterium]
MTVEQREGPVSTIDASFVAASLDEGTRSFYRLLDHIGMLAAVVDDEGRIAYCNPLLLELTGWSADEVLGRKFELFLAPEAVADTLEAHRAVLAERPEAARVETEIVTRAGRRLLTRWSNTVLRDADGTPIGSAHIGEDITERRRLETHAAESEKRYRQLFYASPTPMWLHDRETLRFLGVNAAAIAQYGYTRAEFLAMTIADILPEPERALFAERRKAVAPGAAGDTQADPAVAHSGIVRHRRRDGSVIDVQISSHPLEFAGMRTRFVLAHDVTSHFEQQHKIARLNRIHAVIGGISSAMLRVRDRNELLLEACRVAALEGVFPMAWVAEIDARDRSHAIVASFGPDRAAISLVQNAIRDVFPVVAPRSDGTPSRRPFIVNELAAEPAVAGVREELERRGYGSGAAFPLQVGARNVTALVLLAREPGFFDADEIALLEWMTADLSFALEHIEQSRRLEDLAYYDPLTGIANARLFRDRLEQFVLAARETGEKVSVVVVDVEHFTRINDTLGREVGDELLRRFADRFDQGLVEPYTFGRIAADTFALASPRDQAQVATRLRDCVFELLEEPFEVGGQQILLAVQAGIALFPADGADASAVFQSAESALKIAKANGERYSYFSIEMNARLARRRALEDALRTAIDDRQFVLHYQPRVDLRNGALVGAEALVRWEHPDRGLVPPAEFVSLAEETGLIGRIGEWVIDTVCAQQAAWQQSGLGVVPVAVNLSAFQFEGGDLLRTVREALATHGLQPSLLDLELTESAVMKDPAAAATTLRALRALGVKLALDDFGTGYSSLAHLKRFPFDSVKIDRSFVTDITTNPEDAAIATAIIAMAHRLELKVVAEGVESEGQLRYLRAEGCDEMQGNYFSPAVQRAAFEALLRSGR